MLRCGPRAGTVQVQIRASRSRRPELPLRAEASARLRGLTAASLPPVPDPVGCLPGPGHTSRAPPRAGLWEAASGSLSGEPSGEASAAQPRAAPALAFPHRCHPCLPEGLSARSTGSGNGVPEASVCLPLPFAEGLCLCEHPGG